MPKLIVIASADEFFIPSNTYLWWEQLNGYPNNHMLYVIDNTLPSILILHSNTLRICVEIH